MRLSGNTAGPFDPSCVYPKGEKRDTGRKEGRRRKETEKGRQKGKREGGRTEARSQKSKSRKTLKVFGGVG